MGLFWPKLYCTQMSQETESDCSIDDVIVYGRNELWAIKKHMVKCRGESVVVCTYFG